MLVASPLAETRGEVSSTWRAVSIADSQMGGTTHAATAAPTRMPSENTATAIRTAQLNVLSLPSSSAVTEGSPPPPEEGSTTIVAAVRWPPTFLRLRSLPGHPGAGVLPLSLSMQARRGTRNLCPLRAPRAPVRLGLLLSAMPGPARSLAGDEILRGVNPWRRCLGMAVLCYRLWTLPR
jgi:hypothetical protein